MELVSIEIVILAMIAAFLGLRLYSVLGRRAEHEEEPIQGRFDAKPDPAPQAPVRQLNNPLLRPNDITPPMPAAERAIRDIAAADRRFDPFGFLEGARGAYAMILEAFWRGDKEELSQLCDRDVYESFAAAIDARLAAGQTLDNRLVRVEEATITSASFNAPTARITVTFNADIAAVTRDADGNVIAGSLDDAIQSTDIWTFSRNVNSPDPDWLLVETDEG